MAKSSNKQKLSSKPEGKASECPMCGAAVPEGADECPKCEEPFTPEAFTKAREKEEKGSKLLFITGVILVLIGGPGVALGSYLHDLLRISIGSYDSFDVFGWVNQLVSVVGIIILVVGIIMLILSLPNLRKHDEEDEEEADQDSSHDQGG